MFVQRILLLLVVITTPLRAEEVALPEEMATRPIDQVVEALVAAGLERIVMLLTGSAAVRDVALFPMNQQAQDLLMGAPSEASSKQLRELSIRVVKDAKAGG